MGRRRRRRRHRRPAASNLAEFVAVLDKLWQWRAAPAVLGILVILTAVTCARWTPPMAAPLLGVLVVIGTPELLGIYEREVGGLPAAMPPFVGFCWRPTDVYTVLPAALALAFVPSTIS